MTTYEKERIGDFLAIGNPGDYKVMEQFGSYRMFKRTFRTMDKAVAFAAEQHAKRCLARN